MKKLLLLLSCFLTTWCSVQAANPSGSIKSASYNSSNSEIRVTYKTPNAYSASANLYSNQKSAVVNPKHIRLTPSSSNYITEGIPVNPEWEEGQYWVYLYVNGYIDGQVSDGHNVFPCYGAKVTITATGGFNAPVYNYETEKLPITYNLIHALPSSSIKIFNEDTKKQVYSKGVSNTDVRTSKTITFSSLSDGNYTCRLYSGDREIYRKSFTVKHPEKETTYVNMIPKLTYTGSNLKIDFTLRDIGVNLGFRVHAVSMSGNTGETKTYDYGRYYQHEGTYTVPVPRYTGQVIYAVELLVDGISVDGNSIQVYNR